MNLNQASNEPTEKQPPSPYKTWLWGLCGILSMLGHPLGQLLGVIFTFGWKEEETIVVVFSLICILVGSIRFMVFWLFTRAHQNLHTIVRGFTKANLPALFGIVLFIFISAFIYKSAETDTVISFLYLFVVFTPIIAFFFILGIPIFGLSVRQIKKMRSPHTSADEKIQQVTYWSPMNAPTFVPGKVPTQEERLGKSSYRLLQLIVVVVLLICLLVFLY